MKFKKFLAVMTVFALLLSVFPLSVVAVAPAEEASGADIPAGNVDISAGAVEIVALREECVKHFLLPDGTYKAIVYPYAVHTQDANGNWVEFGELNMQQIGDEASTNAVFYPIIVGGGGDNTQVIFDTYISSASPSTNFGHGETAVLNANSIAFFSTYLPGLPDGAVLTSADLTVSYYFESEGISMLKAYEVLNEWDEWEVTWNSTASDHNNGVSQFPLSSRVVSSHTGGTAAAPETLTVNITGAAKRWYNGESENYGVALRTYGTSNASMYIKNYESAGETRPYFTFNYTMDQESIPSLFQMFIDHEMALPTEVKNKIEKDDAGNIIFADTLFYLLMRPLSELLIQAGITRIDTVENAAENNQNIVNNYYDDFYIMAVRVFGGFRYGLVKMREQEYDNTDGNTPGVTVSFVALEENLLISLLHTQTSSNSYQFYLNLVSITGPGIGQYTHDEDIVAYFEIELSYAPYLIAEQFIELIVQQSCNGGIISAPVEHIIYMNNYLDGSVDNERIFNALVKNNADAGYHVYDMDFHSISIQDPENLSMYEKYAILITHTYNVTFNSFAAEVQFHASMTSLLNGLPYYEDAIRADMGPGEESESGISDGYYYDLDSNLVQAQRDVHGDY